MKNQVFCDNLKDIVRHAWIIGISYSDLYDEAEKMLEDMGRKVKGANRFSITFNESMMRTRYQGGMADLKKNYPLHARLIETYR